MAPKGVQTDDQGFCDGGHTFPALGRVTPYHHHASLHTYTHVHTHTHTHYTQRGGRQGDSPGWVLRNAFLNCERGRLTCVSVSDTGEEVEKNNRSLFGKKVADTSENGMRKEA